MPNSYIKFLYFSTICWNKFNYLTQLTRTNKYNITMAHKTLKQIVKDFHAHLLK